MILSKIIHRLYLKIYISIVASTSKTDICVHTLKGEKLIDAFFETFQGSEVTEEMLSYVQSFVAETPFYYISLLDNSINQGAMFGCKGEGNFKNFNPETSQLICNKGWSSYTSKVDLINLEKKYHSFGLDFIFSPYSVLESFFEDKIEMQATLFVLVQEDSMTVAIFENSVLKYSEFINMRNEKMDESLSLIEDNRDELNFDIDDESAVNLEEIDVDNEFENLDDFTDIEDLDEVDELEDFTEVKVEKPKQHQESFSLNENEEENLTAFNEGYRRFSMIQTSLNRFYTDERYEKKFIESIYIAAACDVQNDLKNYLEEELFLKVYVRQIDLCEEMFDLAKREIV